MEWSFEIQKHAHTLQRKIIRLQAHSLFSYNLQWITLVKMCVAVFVCKAIEAWEIIDDSRYNQFIPT